jgi:hypothetical protein
MDEERNGPPWRGRGHDLEAAIWDAWENAKEQGAGGEKATYKVEIAIEASNPIHSYIVLIFP